MNLQGDELVNNTLKFGLLTLAVGAAAATTIASANVVTMGLMANAPAICQAFVPGISNTIRNRAIGSENIGPQATITCDFLKPFSENDSNVVAVQLYFSNNNTAGSPVTVSCTMLTGYQGMAGAIMVNKTINMGPQGHDTILYDSDDTPAPADQDLGNTLVGVACKLPTGVIVNDTYMVYADEDGVGV